MEHLPCVAPADHRGVLAQLPLVEHLGGEGGVGDLDPVGVREEGGQMVLRLQEGLDVGRHMADVDPGAEDEGAVVYREPQGAQDLYVVPPLHRFAGLDHGTGGDVVGCHDAVVSLSGIDGGYGVARVLLRDERVHVPPHGPGELDGCLLRVGARDAHVGDSHDHDAVNRAAVYRDGADSALRSNGFGA